MNIKSLFIAIAIWLNGGYEPAKSDIIGAIVLVVMLVVVAFIAIMFAITPDAYMELPPYNLLLDIQDYDNDRYKIFLLKSYFDEFGGLKGDFNHLSECIVKRLAFFNIKNKSVCKVSFAESDQDIFAKRQTTDNFRGKLEDD